MLGLLQVLYFKDTYPSAFKQIHAHSQVKEHEFPLMIKLFEFTSQLLKLMKKGKMFNVCNN